MCTGPFDQPPFKRTPTGVRIAIWTPHSETVVHMPPPKALPKHALDFEIILTWPFKRCIGGVPRCRSFFPKRNPSDANPNLDMSTSEPFGYGSSKGNDVFFRGLTKMVGVPFGSPLKPSKKGYPQRKTPLQKRDFGVSFGFRCTVHCQPGLQAPPKKRSHRGAFWVVVCGPKLALNISNREGWWTKATFIQHTLVVEPLVLLMGHMGNHPTPKPRGSEAPSALQSDSCAELAGISRRTLMCGPAATRHETERQGPTRGFFNG